ncbi:MAG: hypothetical protein ACRDFS_00485 [Chloroflexota bacterium]
MKAAALLLSLDDVRDVLPPGSTLARTDEPAPSGSVGEVLRAAATDSVYRRFRGQLPDGSLVTIAELGVILGSTQVAAHTFEQVVKAAHLHTELDGASVAVETVTAPSGLVSYWGFVHAGQAIVILTIDTLDPQRVSIAALRSLASLAAQKLVSAS